MPCTTILVGKKASADGSTLIARNDDSPTGVFHGQSQTGARAPLSRGWKRAGYFLSFSKTICFDKP